MFAYLQRRSKPDYTDAQRMERARQARILLAPDSLLTEAIERAVERALDQWIDGNGQDSAQVHAMMRAFDEVQRSLKIIITDGAVAETRL